MLSARILALFLASLGQVDMDKEFYQDFRRGSAVHHALTPFGPNRETAMQADAKGLRITLPAKRRDTAPVGLSPKFRILGDFEITVAYEIVSADEPPSGQGAGLKIWGRIRSDDDQTMTLAHLIRTKPQSTGYQKDGSAVKHEVRNEFVATVSRQGSDPKGDRDFENKSLPAETRAGRLRLMRTGSELIFLAAEGENGDFQELLRASVSTDAMTALRLSANTSDAASGLSLRLLDLRIRATDLLGAAPPKKRSYASLVIWLSVILVVGGGGYLLWRYRPWQR